MVEANLCQCPSRFFDELGESQPEAEEMPEDPYSTVRTTHYAAERPVGPPKPKDDDLVRYMEASLGLSSTRLYADKLKQFLDNDRKVLRFYCYWDDRNSMGGEVCLLKKLVCLEVNSSVRNCITLCISSFRTIP